MKTIRTDSAKVCRRLMFLAVVLVSLAIITACGDGDDDDAPKKPSTETPSGGNGGGGSTTDAYSMSKLAGVWMEDGNDGYGLCKATIETLERQKASCSTFLNHRNPNFEVYGFKLNADGTSEELKFAVRSSRGSGICLRTISASDGMVYWTQVKSDQGARYTYKNQTLYYVGGGKAYNVVSATVIATENGTLYAKVSN